MKKLWIFGSLCISFLCTISIIFPIIPVSYDEAWNYTNISSKGPLFSITNFPFANNHVFFTFLQSFTVPQKLLWYFPEATRLLNVFVGTAFAMLLYGIVCQFLKKKSLMWFIISAASCFFMSPLVTPYFIVARGYMLGMVLMLCGIYCVSLTRMIAASLFFILSGWTVVTYIYCLPVMFISLVVISKKNDWKKILACAFLTGIGLYICYKPILLLVLSQGILWTSASFEIFLLRTWRSLSYLSFLTYGDVGAVIFSIAYGISLLQCVRGQSPKKLRYMVILLTSAIASYLIMVGVLSFFHLANPPYERAGIFIPLFAGITIISAAIQAKTVWIKAFLWFTLACNTLIGVYFFTTALPYPSASHYPFNISYLAPFPYPLSDVERKLLKEKKIPTLSVPDSGDDTFHAFFSKIYAVPLIYPKKNETPAPMANVKPNLSTASAAIIPISEPSPSLLPSSPFYPLKRIWQNISLQAVTFFSISRKPRITYLVSLSDLTYKEGELLWTGGQEKLAIKTLSRAEHYMTIVAGEAGDLAGLEHQGSMVTSEILPSILLHRQIMNKLMATAGDDQRKDLSEIISFSDRNLQNLQTVVIQ